MNFNEIAIDMLTPGVYVEVDGSGAFQGTPAMPDRILLVGNRLTTGTVAQATLKQILSKANGVDFWGRGSQLAHMIEKAKDANKMVEMWAIALDDDAAGVQATKVLTIGGTATEAGTIHLLIGGRKISAAVALGDSGVEVADAIEDACEETDGGDLICTCEGVGAYSGVVGGTPANGNYDVIFTGYGLGSPETVRVPRDSGSPASNSDLAAAMDAALDTAIAGALAGVLVPGSIQSSGTGYSFRTISDLEGTVTYAAPTGATNVVTETGRITFTCRHKGEFGQDLDVRLNYDRASQKTPAGLTASVADGVTGTTNPDLADALAVLPDKWFTSLVIGYSDATNLATAEAWALANFNGMVMKDSHVFAAKVASAANLITYGNARNSPFSTVLQSGGFPRPPWERAAILAAVEESESDPARPREGLRLIGDLAPALEDQLDRPTRDLLLRAGIATVTVDDSGQVFIERLVTTYKTNPQSVADPTYRDIETLRSIAWVRFDVRAFFATKRARHKLANDGKNYAPGQPILTPSAGRADMIGRYKVWVEAGVVEDNLEAFKAGLIAERPLTGLGADVNRLNFKFPPDFVNQLRIVAAQMAFGL
jgi:phage tail sheath gpL-like